MPYCDKKCTRFRVSLSINVDCHRSSELLKFMGAVRYRHINILIVIADETQHELALAIDQRCRELTLLHSLDSFMTFTAR